MQTNARARHASLLYSPFGGAAVAVALAFAYALIFIVYATIRSAFLVAGAGTEVSTAGTVGAYAVSLIVASLAICLLMAIPAALVGLFTAWLVKRLLSVLNPAHDMSRGVTVAALTCLAIVLLVHFGLQQALGFTVSDIVANPETYLYWLGLPSLIYVAAGGVAGWQSTLRVAR